jgi:hypothetical protein
MRRTSRTVLILCLVSTSSLAQVSLRDIPFVPLEANCPICVRATLEKSGNLLAAQRLQVILGQWPPSGIVATRITVHGMAPVANRREPSEITESLDLSRIVNYPRLVASTGNVSHASTGNVLPWLPPPGEPVIVRVSSPDSRWYAWLTGFTTVSFVDLESATYADGTSWHASNGTPCRVQTVPSVW